MQLHRKTQFQVSKSCAALKKLTLHEGSSSPSPLPTPPHSLSLSISSLPLSSIAPPVPLFGHFHLAWQMCFERTEHKADYVEFTRLLDRPRSRLHCRVLFICDILDRLPLALSLALSLFFAGEGRAHLADWSASVSFPICILNDVVNFLQCSICRLYSE